VYCEKFRPSEQLSEPYVMAGVNVFAADDHADAVEQQTIAYRHRARLMFEVAGVPSDLTDAEIDALLASPRGRPLADMTKYTAVGTMTEVRSYLADFAESIQADELITAHHAFSNIDQVRSVEITAKAVAAIPDPIAR
jgi:alkanesulfonate monooxygenase SsuD/methylene tetrahydromethanopterin reductase-like flavin-dependent oxidoreductase (luciferase family)